MTFSKKNHSTPLHSTPLHSTHSTELFKIFFSLLTLSTAFLQKASGPGKNKLHNKWINARGNETQAKREFKTYRAKLRDVIRTQKSLYFEKRFNNCRGNIKKYWKVLNESRNKRKKLTFPNYINFNGNLITQRRTIIEKFNSYFVNIANKQK